MLKKKFLAAILCVAAALADISLANAAQVAITDMEGTAEAAAPDISGYEEEMISPKATGSEMIKKEAVYNEIPDSHTASGQAAVYASLTHHHTNSCYTQHSHTGSCYGSCTGTAQDPYFEDYGEMGELRGKGYTCSKCGRHIHTWHIDDGDTGKQKGSVCGNRTLTCTLGTSKVLTCGYTEGHDYVLSQTASATCTSNGYYRYTCTCGASYDTPIPATGHTTPSGYSFASNNNIENGTKYKNCAKCGARLETLYRQIVYVRYQNADGTFGNYNAERDDYRTADGSTIFGWNRAEDTTYKAAVLVWDNNSNIVPAYARAGYVTVYRKSLDYTVRHYQQNINDSGYTLKDTESFSASSGSNISPAVKTYTGFTSPARQTKVLAAEGKTTVDYYYTRNSYTVTCIDVVDSKDGKILGKSTSPINYDATVKGSDLGADTADNTYYKQYRYVSDTNATVTTDGATVYRIFKFCYTEKTSSITWNDEDDKDGLRPETYTLKLKQNGRVISEATLSSDQTSYTFSNIPKYDENGNTFDYEIEPVISDRYKISKDEEGNTIIEYQKSVFSVSIPKSITLDGRTGNADYVITVSGVFYYNDTLTVKPTASFIMADRNSISTMQANVVQDKTGFTKEDGVANGTTAKGSVQADQTYFAGLWQGSFHFDIKFEMKN